MNPKLFGIHSTFSPLILLTIVTVTKNCVATLGKTLDSVKAIKGSDIEYVIVDGGSTDGSLELIAEYSGLVDRMVTEPDTGIYNAMNKGVALAQGRYVLFINGDDELVTEGFLLVLKTLKNRSPEVLSATTLVGSVSRPEEVLVANPWLLPFFNSIPHPSTFVTRSLLTASPFREDLRIAADYDFFLQAFLSRRRFLVVPAITALHQRGGASGNSALSENEVQKVRIERLGISYPIVNVIANTYRAIKKFLVPS